MELLVRPLIFVIFIIFIAGALFLYRNPGIKSEIQSTSSASGIVAKSAEQASKILGIATKKTVQSATNLYNKYTDEQEEALINSTVDNITKQVKDLPEQQVKKIKRRFCEDIIDELDAEETAGSDPSVTEGE